MTVYSLLLFLATYGFIHASFADYQCYILLGFAGVCVIGRSSVSCRYRTLDADCL